PESWFSDYSNLYALAEEGANPRLKRHHVGLVQDDASNHLASVTLDRKLQRLTSCEKIEEIPPPKNFRGRLRSYQQAGYNWFNFLREFNFGGCLADDMGLGKTIQALALLEKVREEN